MSGVRRAATVVLAVVLAVVLVAALTAVVTVRRPLPQWSGEQALAGLDAEVRVLRDGNGVAQVYADTATDLFAAQGYVHAQDRFFEMDVRRHVTSGRLAELVGGRAEAVAADRVVRTLGWRRVAEQELPLLDPATRSYLQAYADGVNAYVSGRSPAELSLAYTVLDVQVDVGRIEPWSELDSLTWLKAVAWDLRSNYGAETGRAQALTALGGDPALVAQLYPDYPFDRHVPVVAPGDAEPPAGASLANTLAATGERVTAASSSTTDAGAGALTVPGTSGVSSSQTTTDVTEAVLAAADPLASAQAALDAVPRLLGSDAEDGIGSNSWVVSGEHTGSGLPLLANDPHLAPSMPGIWYQMGLHCTRVSDECPFDVAGFGFSGLPGIVVGHNDRVAWGVTNLYADVTDFFLEVVRGTDYLRDGERVPVEERTEVIEVAGGEPEELTVRSTVHGPIISDVLGPQALVAQIPVPAGSPLAGAGYQVSLSWTALTPGRTMDAVFAINRAQGWDEFREASRLFEVPAQNLVYADVDGNIGYQAPGRIPVRADGPGLGQADGTYPRLGWDSAWDWTGEVPFEDLPSVLNPPEGYLVAANQAVTGTDRAYLLSRDTDYGYRSQRIRDRLAVLTADGGTVTAADMAELQTDTRNGFAEVLVPYLLATPLDDESVVDASVREFTEEARALLGTPGGEVTWDLTQPADSAAAAYYNAVWSNLLRLTFADQLPEAALPEGGSRSFEVVRALLPQADNPFWDDLTTPTITESRDQVLGQALVDARLELTASLGKDPQQWQWGDLHRLTMRQQVLGADSVPAPVRGLFTSDSIRLGGGSSIVDATSWDATEDGDYSVTAIPSMRMVVDLADLDASTWIDPTGVSGHPWSSHYGDQTEAWARGEQLAWPFTPDAVAAAAEDELVLRPGP